MNKAAQALARLSVKKRWSNKTKEEIRKAMKEMSTLGNKKRWAGHKKKLKRAEKERKMKDNQ